MKAQKTISRRMWIQGGLAALVIAALAAFVIYYLLQSTRVYVDAATIQAPIISLAPTTAGKLQEVFVNEGDEVAANTPVAQVGNELVKTQVAGLITSVPNQIGAQITPGQEVVEMIDPTELRVVGKVDEDKGLSRIAVGQRVAFSVDAFSGKSYSGVVDEVSPTSEQSGIVFNISNQQETMQFDVKVRFDTTAYPELKNGMSAHMWIYTE